MDGAVKEAVQYVQFTEPGGKLSLCTTVTLVFHVRVVRREFSHSGWNNRSTGSRGLQSALHCDAPRGRSWREWLVPRFGTANVRATGTEEYRTVPASTRYGQRTERSSGSFAPLAPYCFHIFIKENDSKFRDFEMNFFRLKSIKLRLFSLRTPRSRLNIAYSSENCTKKLKNSIEKVDPKSIFLRNSRSSLRFSLHFSTSKKLF